MDKIIIEVKGRKIERLIKKLINNKIKLYRIKIINSDLAHIVISKNDYLEFIKLKTIYEYQIIGSRGLINIRKKIKINRLLIIFILLSIITIKIISNMIFHIEVVYNDSKWRNFIIEELAKKGIKKYSFKKSFEELSKIKEEILEEYKDKIEWLEIEELGTNYIIRLEERKINTPENDNKKYNIVSSKDAIIKRIDAEKGQIVKEINNYVTKGDIIISGNISLNDEIKGISGAKGNVYGEVWYKVIVSFPLRYYDEKEKGNKKNIIDINIFNNNFFNKNKNYRIISQNKLYENTFIPFSISINQVKEIEKIDTLYTIDEAIIKAEELGKQKIKSKLNDNESIIETKNLKVDIKDSKIELDMFIVTYENIAQYQEIVEE